MSIAPTLTKQRHFYETFPFLKFFRLMDDEALIEKEGVSTEDWQEIKKKWVMTHEDWSKDEMAIAKKNEMRFRGRYNKLLFLKERALMREEGLEDLFKAVKIRWEPDRSKRDGYLLKQIQKSKKLHEIHLARLKQVEKRKVYEISEEKKFTVTDAYQCLASLELAGANIPDYEKMTLGKYDALNVAIARQNGKNREKPKR